jgi:hypothetical protein
MPPRATKVAQECPYFQHEYPRHPQIGMNHPELILVPWAVFAVALALKARAMDRAGGRVVLVRYSSSEPYAVPNDNPEYAFGARCPKHFQIKTRGRAKSSAKESQ